MMTQKQIQVYCLKKKGVAFDYKEEWQATRGQIENKMFIMLGGDQSGKPIVSLKCDPLLAEAYRKEYDGVVPGYYLNKMHWNSIYMDSAVPNEKLMEMIDLSYELVLKSLPKKSQQKYRNGE